MSGRVYNVNMNIKKDIIPPAVRKHNDNMFTIINPQKLFNQWSDLNLSWNQYTIVKKFIWFDSHKLIPHMIVSSTNTQFVSCTYQHKV